jgi:pilus assembly protein FimV
VVRELYPVGVCVLALWGTATHALGLGGLRQLSALDQPFVGEIELIDASQDELDSMKAQIASQAEFARVGSERYHYLSKLRFSPQVSARGKPVIRVTSRDPIREPYMDFLVEVVWPSGRLVRQFTLLLDPPATTSRPVPRIAPPVLEGRHPPESSPTSVASTPTETPVPAQAAAQASAKPGPESYRIPATATTAGYPKRYGPVRSGVGLWRLARANTPRGATVAQTAMALFRNNQDAFANGDIQRLRVGQTLTLPHAGELFALSPASAKREYDAALRDEEVQRSPIAAAPPVSAASEAEAPRLRIAGAAEQPAVATTAKPEPREASTEAMEKELLLVRETSESAHQEALEMRGRIRDLETQLAEIQQLLKLRNEELARVQGGKGSAPVGPPGVLGTPPAPRQVVAPGGPSAGPGAVAGATAPAAAGLPPQTPPDQGPQAALPAPETKPPPVQAGGAGTTPAAARVSKPPVMPPVVDDLVGDSPWLALWLPLAGIVGVTALGIGALAWLRLRRRAERDAEFASTVTEPSAGRLPARIPDRGLAVLVGRVKGWLGLRRLVGRQVGQKSSEVFSEAFGSADVPEETTLQPVSERGVVGLVHRAQRWLHSRRPGGPAAGPESESTDLSEDGIPSQAIPETVGMPTAPFDGTLSLVIEDAGESLTPALELLTLPQYRLPTDQVPVAAVTVEPPPVEPRSVESAAPDGAALKTDLGDTLSKADVYLAYGRYGEAEDFLREELRRWPGQLELKLKLADVYDSAGNREALRGLMQELQAAGIEQSYPQEWQRLVDRVPIAPSAVADNRAPDNENPQALDYLDLDLDLDFDIDELGPVDHLDLSLAAIEDLQTEDDLSDETTVKLDLARVYLEMGDQESARDLLDEVIGEGTEAQCMQARELLRRVV